MEMDFDTKYDRLYVAVVLPFKNGTFEPDEQQLRSLLRMFTQPEYVEAGIGIIINPEAGEIFYLDRSRKRRIVEIAAEEVKGKVPLFAGAIDNTTEGTGKVAKDAMEAGADGLFIMPPTGAGDITASWNPSKYPEVWIDMAKQTIATAGGDMPVICHPTASISPAFGVGLPVDATLQMCREIPNIVGWKMTYSYNGYRIVARALRNAERRVAILTASGVFFHEALSTGQSDGALSGSFNYALELMVDHIKAWRRGDLQEARRIWDGGLAELHEYVYSDFSRLHIRYKTATWLRGHISNPFMIGPMPKPRKEEVHTLYRLLSNTGLHVIPRAEAEHLAASLDR